MYRQPKEYRYCGITVPVHSPLESLAHAMSLVEPPDDAIETNWYEVWAVCIARLIGVVSPEQAPTTLNLIRPSPWFELPAAWDSKYLVGTSISLRKIDLLGQLVPNRQEADEKWDMIRRDRCRFAVKCGVQPSAVTSGQASDEPYFETESGFEPLVGLCATHMPSCIILK